MSWWTPLRGGLDRLKTLTSSPPEPTAAVPIPVVPARPSVPSVPAWTGVAPVQRSLRDPIEPVATYDTFAGSLAAFRNPSFLAPLSHRVDPGAGGLVDGLADLSPGTPKPYAPTSDLTVRPMAARSSTQRPAVQRVWGSFVSSPDVVPMERPDLVDANDVREVADAGLTGTGMPEAPVSVADDGSAPTPPASPVEPDLPVAQGPRARTESGPAATSRTRTPPDLSIVQRQLHAVPDRPARRVAAPSTPTLELPVLRLVEPPARGLRFPEPVEASRRARSVTAAPPTGPVVTEETSSPTVARLAAESEPELAEVPDPTPEPGTEGGVPTPDAPLSGFAAAIVALNGPASDSPSDAGMPVPAPAPGPPAASASPSVQRSAAEWLPADRLEDSADRQQDPAAQAEPSRFEAPDLLPGLPVLPVLPTGRPSAAAPTVLRSIESPGWSQSSLPPAAGTPTGPDYGSSGVEVGQPASGELPLATQRPAGHPSAALVGSRPPLVQRQESNAAVLPPAVQPIQFSRPTYPSGPAPVTTAASSHPQAAVIRPDLPEPAFTAQRLAAPGAAQPAAAVPLPAVVLTRPTPVPAPPIPVPLGVLPYATATAEPAPAAMDRAPRTTPAAAEWSSPPSTPTTEDPAAAESYEVVQLDAGVEDAGLGTASHPSRPAPSVQRSPANGPVHAATGGSSGPISFASMFAGVDAAAGEDGYTSVQLLSDEAVPVDAPPPSAPLAAAPAAPAGAAPAAAAAPADVDELARRLFEPLSARIRAELRLDRERSGLMTDVRP